MPFFRTFTEICCLAPCPIAFIVVAIPACALAFRRRRARDIRQASELV